MARSFTPEEKALLLAYRKATGKPLVGKYSTKQLAEYNDWAEQNDKPSIDVDNPLPSDDEASDDDAEEEPAAGRGTPRRKEKQAEQDDVDDYKPSRKRGRPPKVAGKRGRPPKAHKQSSTPAVAQESLEDLERRIELEEKLAAARAKRAEADMQLAAAAEKVAAAKMTEARAKVIAACAADNLAAAAAGEDEEELY